MNKLFQLIGYSFLFILAISSISAQTIDLAMVPDSTSALEFDYKRLLISDSDQGIVSGTYDLDYKHVLGEKLNLVAELTYVNFTGDASSDNGISNIYLGTQIKSSGKDNVFSSINAGVYLPTISAEDGSGVFNSIYDFSKLVPDIIAFHLGYGSYYFLDNGLRLGFQTGADLIIPTNDDNFNENEVLAKYGGSILYETSSGLYFQAELLGIFAVTEDDSFADRTFHTYGVGLGYNWGQFGIGVNYKNYFDEFFTTFFNGILGVELNTRL